MTVEFKDVGRSKLSWTATIKGVDVLDEILRAVKKKKALGSKYIDIEILEDGTGTIIVGGFRTVGAFTIIDYVLAN